MNGDPLWLSQVVIAAFADIAFACTLGAGLLSVWLSKEKAVEAKSPAHAAWQKARRLSIGGAVVLAAANLMLVWLQAASMSGTPLFDAFSAVVAVVTSTHAGIGWAIAFGGSVLLNFAMVFATAKGSPRLGLFAVGAIVAAAGKASIGHAADAGAFSLAEGVQTIHLLATALWGGVVFAGAWSVLSALGTSLARAFLIRTAGKMSTMSVIAVSLVVATGIYNAWRGLGGSAEALEASAWGQALVVKAVLVATALLLGAMNRWSVLPRLQRTASTVDARTFTGVMRVEAVLIVAVFVAAAVLSHSVPGFASAG
ncbi:MULTISPECIES: copper resistance D family protein [Burkholderiaceae]|uniref:Copper resistance protein D n=1 Tax=Caballeronia sordidicola TaxID=196367 RepID=A0A242MNU6_CABSO|nr:MULTISPECIES: CopD family protein [Burkholderiaceae]AME23937.1 copper resistance protein CopD [Burkholderia sp. PAMC 26561]OTP72998.1 Copper resistance protein D [Caballeronia sordidicola]